MKKIKKTILYNIIIFFVLLIFINFISALLIDGYRFYNNHKKIGSVKEERALLHYYKDFEWGRKYFEEYSKLQTEYRSYYGWKRLPFYGTTINIDSNGIRKTIQSPYVSDTVPIAIFLGGSTIWGTGSSDEYTIPSLFASKTNGKYKVFNYGETGFRAYQELQFLQLKVIEGITPQLVISYDGVNNSPAFCGFFSHVNEGSINLLYKADRKRRIDFYFYRNIFDLISKIKTQLFTQSSHEAPVFNKERDRDAAIELLESWLLTRRLCLSIGAEYICILQPNALVGDPNIENIITDLEYHKSQKSYDYYSDVLVLLDSEKYAILKKHFINLTDAYDRIPNIYLDFCHVSPNGNKIIVDSLINHLEIKK